jgi:NAD(P)-dependent dehydrogenase (short-subunit alcohol dehydrogenase family)
VINLSSAAQSEVDFEAFTKFRPMSDVDAYSQSKAAITMWSQELAARHPEGPAFVSVNPGSLLGTKMVKEGFGIEGKDVTIGAEILVRLATDPRIQAHSGEYFCNDQGIYAAPDPCVSDDQARQRIMTLLDQMTIDAPSG